MLYAYNGWEASPDPADFGGLDDREVLGAPGVRLAPGIRRGDAAVVLFYFAAQLHARVESGEFYAAGDEWGYSFRPSKNDATLLSTHGAGVAFDWNATRHPNGKRGTFTPAQVAEIRRIQAEVEGAVYWGGDAWGNGTPDEMHFELIKDRAKVADVAAKLRAVGWLDDTTPDPTHEEDFLSTLNPDETKRVLAAADLLLYIEPYFKEQMDRLPDEDAQTDALLWAVADPKEGLRIQLAMVQGQLAGITAALHTMTSGAGIDFEKLSQVARDAATLAATKALGGLADALKPKPAPAPVTLAAVPAPASVGEGILEHGTPAQVLPAGTALLNAGGGTDGTATEAVS
jgi:hypothetical protein